ncbi:hypothetical protein tb265_07950 [Gemmatimonadetes bacterium T265]|nr:hypothetical protein tb265_07950 [Gemmatimonadetes bacterium T265]
MTPARIDIPPAAALLDRLAAQHGPLLFHRSGGCCDGSAPTCYPRGEFRVGQRDVYLGDVAGPSFYIGDQQYAHRQHTHLTVDVVPGRGDGFSVEAPEGVRFLTRSRLFGDAEWAALEAAGPAPRGDERGGVMGRATGVRPAPA